MHQGAIKLDNFPGQLMADFFHLFQRLFCVIAFSASGLKVTFWSTTLNLVLNNVTRLGDFRKILMTNVFLIKVNQLFGDVFGPF